MVITEEEYMERAAKKIVELDLEPFAMIALPFMKPISFIGGELATFFLAPLLIIFQDEGFNFIDIFKKRKNIDKLLEKIEDLNKQKVKVKRGIKKTSLISKLKNKFLFKNS